MKYSRKEKTRVIQRALSQDPVDIRVLRQLAASPGGLVNDELRRSVWPKLMDVNIYDLPRKRSACNIDEHFYYDQVVLDVNRSLKRFPPGMSDLQRERLQGQMTRIIIRILLNHTDLHYYQGFHDICVTFLLVVGESLCLAIVDKLAENHLRDFMDKSMEKTTRILDYMYPILDRASPSLCEYMQRADVGTIFCLPWLITWYGHVLSDFKHVVRLYDFFLACHPLMPIYLGVAIVLHRGDEILACPCDMPSIHSLLSKVPSDLPFEQLISKAGDLFLQFGPDSLAKDVSLYRSHLLVKYAKLDERRRHQRPDAVLSKWARPSVIQVPIKNIYELLPELARQRTATKYVVWSVSGILLALLLLLFNEYYEWHLQNRIPGFS